MEDDAAPGPITGELPELTVGESAQAVIQSEGRPAPTYQIIAGALPEGLTLDAQTGEIHGTPTVAGTYAFTVEASNGVGTSTTREFTGEVIATDSPDPDPDPDPQPDPDEGADPDEDGDNGNDDSLPTTGANLGGLAGIALLTLIGGWFISMTVRRRRLL